MFRQVILFLLITNNNYRSNLYLDVTADLPNTLNNHQTSLLSVLRDNLSKHLDLTVNLLRHVAFKQWLPQQSHNPSTTTLYLHFIFVRMFDIDITISECALNCFGLV